MKMKKIKLADVGDEAHVLYRVEQLTDSVCYRVGQILAHHEVQALCRADRWTVTVIPKGGKNV